MFIRIQDLSKIYYKNKKPVKEALKCASFDIRPGEIFALLGVNGAGKTTLSTILASLHPPSSGDVEWKEESIYKNILSYRKIIGFCPQSPNLDHNVTLSENLLFAGRCYGLNQKEAIARKDVLLKKFRLEEYAGSFSKQLSGGYRQRFLIARAMMHSPVLVILDEPTVGLDPHIRRQLWGVIRELKEDGIAVLLTTHYLDEAETLADRVALIHEGQIRTIDSPENLKASHEKKTLEEVFLKFVDDPDAGIFNTMKEGETCST